MNSKLISIRGKQLYVEEYGSNEKPPILYLHGGPGESCFDFTFHQKDRLESFYRVIAIDQRGVCRSEVIGENEIFSLDDIIEDCECLREHLGIEKWSLIGHSFGGYLALLYVSRFPDSIDRVVFECPTFDFALTSRFLLEKTAKLAKKYGNEDLARRCFELANNQEKTTQQLTEEYMKLSDELGENRMDIYTFIKENPTDYSIYSDEEWDKFYDKSEIHYDRLRDERKIFESLLNKIKEVQRPMLLMTAEHDAATCETHIQSFSENAKIGEIYHFVNCGHTPHYEQPDEFTKVIKEFIK
ncbi:alpha/beta fold hydrolase [Bacillus pinisoli]|uniref:alpha/beta fold hydrolase n=1 Tax=Bacillus pinisoli TaxID=2901866 RepID=UPI001FF25785|nr:alpha/beta hydrolase [Bacillus pinisoli]